MTNKIADKPILLGFLSIALLILIGFVFWIASWFVDTANVTKDQFGPKTSIVKYEWFIDASNAIEAKYNDIKVYEISLNTLEEQYKENGKVLPRSQWSRSDIEAYNQKAAEIAGIKASYNNLVREYNSNSSKFNWNYVNTTSKLPRTYLEK